VISIKDNDSLAARVASEISSDLLILLSDVEGLYSSPPGTEGSRLIHTYSPEANLSNIVYGEKSRVGLGGMDSKVLNNTHAYTHIHTLTHTCTHARTHTHTFTHTHTHTHTHACANT